MEFIHAFSVFSICSVAAHGADLLVDVPIAVDVILLGVADIDPPEYRIIDLPGMAAVSGIPGTACGVFLWRSGCLLDGRGVFRLPAGIGEVIRGHRRLSGLFL